MRGSKYVLNGRTPVAADVKTWAASSHHRVARTKVADGVEVSTVFLGIDHQYGDGPPLLFETMVFGGPLNEEQDRYSTYDEAERGHAAMCERVKAAL